MFLDRKKIYSSAKDFFVLKGDIVMKLTSDAAIEVCESAVESGLVIARVEGGFGTFQGLRRGLTVFGMELVPLLNLTLRKLIILLLRILFGKKGP